MSDQNRKLWPFRPRNSYIFSILILAALLVVFVIAKTIYSWPGQELERIVLLGIFIIGLLPILLRLVDVVIERGAVVEFKGLKFDFSQVQKMAASGITIPANIGVTGQSVTDSSTTQILDALRQAVSSNIVIIDLEDGQAWWETRLLVLLSGAVRHNQPKTIVFVATDGGVEDCFQGWGSASDLLPLLLKAHPKYSLIYHSAVAAARQWELVEPLGPNILPPPPGGMSTAGLAGQHPWMAFDQSSGLPNKFFAEQLLASELGAKIEQTEPPRTISIVRLEELFRPVLFKAAIDEIWPSERQLSEFFDRDMPYMAITRNGQFKSLISRTAVVNKMVGVLVQNK